jgi:hypothetical protein
MDIQNPIPFRISFLTPSADSSVYIPQDVAYDTALGGMPWISKIDDTHPYMRELVDIRKQQFDNFAEPGEQSLQGWWLRSQSDFRGGAGILYQDPDTDNQFNIRFSDSCGVNTWDAGELKILPAGANPGGPQPTAGALVLLEGGINGYWRFFNNQAQFVAGGSTASNIGTTTGNILSTTTSGNDYYVSTALQIYKGTGSSAPAVLWTTTGTTTSSVDFIKGRLMGSFDNKVYELVGGTPPTLPAPKYTHPTAAYKFNGFAEGPNAIYASGNDGTSGSIFKFQLDTTGGVPTLASGVVTAQMPLGETINHIYSYIGTFVGISTNRGFRVATIDVNGDLAYGPLLWNEPSGRITGWDSFLFVCVNSTHAPVPTDRTAAITSGVYRVNLGRQIQEQSSNSIRYAYAKDVFWDLTPGKTGTTKISDVTTYTGTIVLGLYDNAIGPIPGDSANFLIDPDGATILMDEGWLETGRIRYNTEEPKLYKFGSIRAAELDGNLDVYYQIPGDIFRLAVSYGTLSDPKTGDFSLTNIPGAQNWIKLMFDMRSDATQLHLFGPELNGWQLKALPGSIRQRFITKVFECFDMETDMTGQRVGYEGYAFERLQKFENMAQTGDSVTFQDLNNGVSSLVVIEGYQYIQSSPAGPGAGKQGGYLTVKMRTVGDTVTPSS